MTGAGRKVLVINLCEMGVDEMTATLAGCQALACCLGHNLSLKGMYGHPRGHVAGTVRLVYESILKHAPGHLDQ